MPKDKRQNCWTDFASYLAEAEAPEKKKRKKAKKQAQNSRILQNQTSQSSASPFLSALRQGDATNDFSQLVKLLRDMSPTAVDQEVQSMQASTFSICSLL